MSDNKDTIIKCPACAKPMRKVFIESANCYIDICTDGCGGIYFDNREFKKFDEQHENIDEMLQAYKEKKYEKVNESEIRICPICGNNMVKHYTNIKLDVEVDECYTCGGMFLDYGELEEIRGQFATEEERSKAFKELFDVSEFKDYEPKDVKEMFVKKGFHPILNKYVYSAFQYLNNKLF